MPCECNILHCRHPYYIPDFKKASLYLDQIRGGDLMPEEKKKMEKAEEDCVYVCDCCGCEVVCRTPSEGPLMCCGEVMCCC
jgi:hypothetical protein